jgi:hypothetical protein
MKYKFREKTYSVLRETQYLVKHQTYITSLVCFEFETMQEVVIAKTTFFKSAVKIAKELIDFDNAVLITDDYRGYIPFKKLIQHHTVNHSVKEYARGQSHTNTIEGFWSLLKRGIVGQYHYLSDKHLNKYILEFCYKYNNRENANVFNNLLSNAVSL